MDPHDTDQPLIRRLRAGDESAFRTVWDLYASRLAAFANSYVHSSDVAADVVQHVFVTLWQAHASLQPRGTLSNYLFAAVRHYAWNVIKHDRIVRRHAAEPVEDDAAYVRNIGELTVEADELALEARRLLSALSPRTREIFLMHREDNLTPAEIASILALSPQTVYNQLARAAKVLAEGLAQWRLG